jgi:ethanolamine utilization cobalamin adenosyltransferase
VSTIGKILVTIKNINEFLVPGSQNFVLKKDMMLTPGAKDYLRNNSYTICFKENVSENVKEKEESLEIKVRRILESEFNIKDKRQIEVIANAVIEKLKNS